MKHYAIYCAVAGALMLPWAHAARAETAQTESPKLTLEPTAVAPATTEAGKTATPVLTLDATEAPGSAIHGFGELAFSTHYITPRGLVVSNKGLTIQPIVGVVFDLYNNPNGPINDVSAVVGIWNDYNSAASNRWVEFDWFAGMSMQFYKNFEAGFTFVDFISPHNSFKTEHNIEFKLAYDDTDLLGAFALHPYIKPFYAVAGDSTVVTGKAGGTFDVEIGMAPGYTFKGLPVPVTLSLPTWITVGPSEYWAAGANEKDGNFGVFSIGPKFSIPLTFIPAKYGNWHFDVGMQYYHMINDNLTRASAMIGTGGHEDVLAGTCALGFSF